MIRAAAEGLEWILFLVVVLGVIVALCAVDPATLERARP